MAITISCALLLFIILAVAVRAGRSTIPTAICAVFLGFALASTGLAPALRGFLATLQTAIASL